MSRRKRHRPPRRRRRPPTCSNRILSQPSLSGSEGADHLVGSDGADWLSAGAGNDLLQGGDGNDVLEGGAGSDLLQGGAGDDRYLFRSGESGLDTIRDAEGSNIAELAGFTGARLEGVVVGHDLVVVVDYAPIFKVENFVGNEAAFAGVQNGRELRQPRTSCSAERRPLQACGAAARSLR